MIGLRQKAGARRSQRRSGIQGALSFRGGAGDYLNVRLAGTPAGRFAAITERRFTSERLLAEAEGWRACFLQFFCKKRDSRGAGARGHGYQGLDGCSG